MYVDNPINQTILTTFMRRKKIKYDVAKNGEEAVGKWKSGKFHLILVRASHELYIAYGHSEHAVIALFLDGYSNARYGWYRGN